MEFRARDMNRLALNKPPTHHDPTCGDLMTMAEREFTAFFTAVAWLFGSETRGGLGKRLAARVDGNQMICPLQLVNGGCSLSRLRRGLQLERTLHPYQRHPKHSHIQNIRNS
jgi:hypothetical protein